MPVDDAPETTVTVHHDNGAGYGTYERLRIPCTAEQLKEIAGKILTGEKTLAFGQWEGTQVSRGVLLDFRNFLMANRFAVSAGMGQVALTHEGEGFLYGYLDKHTLPTEYKFLGETDA